MAAKPRVFFVAALLTGLLTGAGLTGGEQQVGENLQRPPGGLPTDPPERLEQRERVLQPPDGAQVTGGAIALAPSGAASAPSCSSRGDDGRLCVHGSEPPPPGIDTRLLPSVAQLRARRFGPPAHSRARSGRGPASSRDPSTAGMDADGVVTPEVVAAEGTAMPCVTDGVTGPRVQAVYAHAADKQDRYTDVLPLITTYAGDVVYRVNAAAGRSGQGRLVRFVTSAPACTLAVDHVTLSPAGDDSFANTVAEMRALGYNRPDRKYLVWVDAAVGICGLGHVFSDARATLDNLNTRGNMFARVDTPCWGYAELHELLHTLGAVQDPAPNSTGAGHCVDEQDAMCYSDTSNAAMREECADAPSWNVDCHLDDYFNASPPAESYLATHWNTAQSPYLALATPPPDPPKMTTTSRSSALAGTSWQVGAGITLPAGRTIQDFTWTTTRSDCAFADPTATATRFWCPVTAAGAGQVSARVTDSAGTQTSISDPFTLTIPTTPRRTVSTLRAASTSLVRGDSTDLRVALTDRASGSPVIGMPVALYRRIAGTSTWEKVSTRPSSSHGVIHFEVGPTRITDYTTVSGTTRTWDSSQSPTRRVKVTP